MLSGIIVFLLIALTAIIGGLTTHFTYTWYIRHVNKKANLNHMRDIELGNLSTSRKSLPGPPPPAKDKATDSPYSNSSCNRSTLSWLNTTVTPPAPSYLGPSAENTNIGIRIKRESVEHKTEGDGVTVVNDDDDAWTDVDITERSAVTGFDFGFGSDDRQPHVQHIVELEGDSGAYFQRR
jgi:hypothetical protein